MFGDVEPDGDGGDDKDGLVLPSVVFAFVPMLVEAVAPSGRQSMCTALAERSMALPVDRSASLPAFGWLSSLQRGVRPGSAAARCAALARLRGVAAFSVDDVLAPDC